MQSSDAIVIRRDKPKLLFLAFGQAMFVALGVCLVVFIIRKGTPFPAIFLVAVGVVDIVWFGSALVWSVTRLFDAKPALIIDSEGIVDNVSVLAVGRIPWQEITGIEVCQFSAKPYLAVHVEDFAKYVRRAGPLRRWFARITLNYPGTAVNISAAAMRIGLDDLKALLAEGMAKHRDAKLL
jgi:hypothetical protein